MEQHSTHDHPHALVIATIGADILLRPALQLEVQPPPGQMAVRFLLAHSIEAADSRPTMSVEGQTLDSVPDGRILLTSLVENDLTEIGARVAITTFATDEMKKSRSVKVYVDTHVTRRNFPNLYTYLGLGE